MEVLKVVKNSLKLAFLSKNFMHIDTAWIEVDLQDNMLDRSG